MTISEILSSKGSEVASVASGTTVRDTVALLAAKRIGAVPVIEGGGIRGIFSERDLVACLCDHGSEALDWPVDRAMSSPVETVDMQTPVLSALATMTQRRMRHLPVVESGEIGESCRSATWSSTESSGSKPKRKRFAPISKPPEPSPTY